MTDAPNQTAERTVEHSKQVELIISEWKRSVYREILSLSTMTLLAQLAIKALRSQKP